MKWSEGGNLGDGRFDFRRDHYGIFVVRAAVDDAVSDNINFRRSRNRSSIAVPKTVEQLPNGLGARTGFCALFPGSLFRILERDFRNLAIPLDLSLPLRRRRVVGNGVANLIETAL